MHHPLEKGFIDWESMQELKKKGCFIKAANWIFSIQRIDFFDFSIDSAFDFIESKFYFPKLILAF